MIRVLSPAALVLLAACSGGLNIADLRPSAPSATPAVVAPPTPQPTLLTAKERLVAAIEDNGCALTTDNVGTILTEATISREELLQLAPQLQAEGRAEVSGSGAISVISDNCSA